MISSSPKVILITGCSSGFGLLMAARLTAKKHKVMATMRDPGRSQALTEEVNKRDGQIETYALDVTKPETIQKTVQEIISKHSRIDVLINNAGYGIGGFFEDLTQDEIRAQMEANFFGVQNVCRTVIPIMRRQGKGRIINISSVAGFSASPAFGAYNASKWALEAFSESLYYEMKFFGIDVVLIEPGTYRTKIFHENARYAKNFDNNQSPYYAMSQVLKKKVLDYVTPLRKDPEAVAALAERLIESPRPAFRNIPDLEGRILYFSRRLLPFSIYSRFIETVLFGNFRKKT